MSKTLAVFYGHIMSHIETINDLKLACMFKPIMY